MRALHHRAAHTLNIQMTLSHFRLWLQLPAGVKLLPPADWLVHCRRAILLSSSRCTLAVRLREVDVVVPRRLAALRGMAWFRTYWCYHIRRLDKMVARLPTRCITASLAGNDRARAQVWRFGQALCSRLRFRLRVCAKPERGRVDNRWSNRGGIWAYRCALVDWQGFEVLLLGLSVLSLSDHVQFFTQIDATV